MKNQVKALKVKIKSLQEEARIIRLEERRVLAYKKPDPVLYFQLRMHRITDVRKEQRSALLAYGFIRGREYKQVEKNAKPGRHQYMPDLPRIHQLIEKFGGLPGLPLNIAKETVAAWMVKGSAVHKTA